MTDKCEDTWLIKDNSLFTFTFFTQGWITEQNIKRWFHIQLSAYTVSVITVSRSSMEKLRLLSYFWYPFTCILGQAAIPKYHRLGALTMELYFLTVLEAEESKTKVWGEFSFWWGPSSWLSRRPPCHCALMWLKDSSHVSLLLRTLIPSWGPHTHDLTIPRASSPNTIILGNRDLLYEFGGNTIQSIATWLKNLNLSIKVFTYSL